MVTEPRRPAEHSSLVTVALSRLTDATPDHLPDELADLAGHFGLDDVAVYLADLQEAVLAPWPETGRSAEAIDGTLAGRAFQRGAPVAGADGRWWFPIVDSGDRIGVVSLRFATDPGDGDQEQARALVTLVGLLITSGRLRCDSIVRACRRQEVTLAAETRWSVLPPRSLAGSGVVISGHLEPAYEIAGDTFDYGLSADHLDLAVFDAMGHGLQASQLANMAVMSYRHSRRAGRDLVQTYQDMDQAILSAFGEGVFVTAHLARLELATGVLSVVNAGHPSSLLIRGGTAHPLEFRAATPVGLALVAPVAAGQIRLEPGDAILVVSDGVSEARSAGGHLFGVERIGDLAVRALAGGETVQETVRRLLHDVLGHRGVELEDDATVVMLTWRPERARAARDGAGASP